MTRRGGALWLAVALTALAGAGAPLAHADVAVSAFSVTPASTQAGAPVRVRATAAFAYSAELDDVRDVVVQFAPGLALDPRAAERCTAAEWDLEGCPVTTVVGSVELGVEGLPETTALRGGVVNLMPDAGEPGHLGLLLPRQGDLGEALRLEATVVVGGPPARPAFELTVHDLPHQLAGPSPEVVNEIRITRLTIALAAQGSESPFARNPTSCREAASGVRANSHLAPLSFGTATSSFTPTGCGRLRFAPVLAGSVGIRGRGRTGSSPSLALDLRLPGSGAAAARAALVLPRALAVAASRGGPACPAPALATDSCPPAAAAGGVSIRARWLPRPLTGPLLVTEGAAGGPPPLLARARGAARIDLPVRLERAAGRTRLVIDEMPDLPLSRVRLSLDPGLLRAARPLCGAPLRARSTVVAQSGRSVRRAVTLATPGCPRGR